MNRFWRTDAQFAKVARYLPTDTRGRKRLDNRRVISGIVHVLKSGGRWAELARGRAQGSMPVVEVSDAGLRRGPVTDQSICLLHSA